MYIFMRDKDYHGKLIKLNIPLGRGNKCVLSDCDLQVISPKDARAQKVSLTDLADCMAWVRTGEPLVYECV